MLKVYDRYTKHCKRGYWYALTPHAFPHLLLGAGGLGLADLKTLFGKNVAALRKGRGLTQDGLASAAQLSLDTIKRIETGKVGASFEVVERLALALSTEPDRLFRDESRSMRGDIEALLRDLETASNAEIAWLRTVVAAARRRPEV